MKLPNSLLWKQVDNVEQKKEEIDEKFQKTSSMITPRDLPESIENEDSDIHPTIASIVEVKDLGGIQIKPPPTWRGVLDLTKEVLDLPKEQIEFLDEVQKDNFKSKALLQLFRLMVPGFSRYIMNSKRKIMGHYLGGMKGEITTWQYINSVDETENEVVTLKSEYEQDKIMGDHKMTEYVEFYIETWGEMKNNPEVFQKYKDKTKRDLKKITSQKRVQDIMTMSSSEVKEAMEGQGLNRMFKKKPPTQQSSPSDIQKLQNKYPDTTSIKSSE